MAGKSFELLCTEMYIIHMYISTVYMYTCSSEKLKSKGSGLTQLGRQWWSLRQREG